jgi:hypothetical protein
VNGNRPLESVSVAPARLETHEISPPPEFRDANLKLRFIRFIDGHAAEIDSALRNLQISRLSAKNSIFEPPRPLALTVRRRLDDAASWDGVSILGTNLPDLPEYLASLFLISSENRSWGRELTRFGASGFALEHFRYSADDDMLEGWSIVALLAHSLRHFLLLQLSERSEGAVTWTAVQRALRENHCLRITKGQRALLLNGEPGKLMANILAVLKLKAPSPVEYTASEAADGLDSNDVTAPFASQHARIGDAGRARKP